MADGSGFVAALDQSAGSTPRALRLYSVKDSRYATNEQMFDAMHEFRSRIIASPAFAKSGARCHPVRADD